MTDAETLLKARGSKHGDFTCGAQFTQDVMDVFHQQANWRLLEAFHKEGIHMIVHKLQRIMTGQWNFDDHWLDIEGYARCVRERLHLMREPSLAIVSGGTYNKLLTDLSGILKRQPNYEAMDLQGVHASQNVLSWLGAFVGGREGVTSSIPWLEIERIARERFEAYKPVAA